MLRFLAIFVESPLCLDCASEKKACDNQTIAQKCVQQRSCIVAQVLSLGRAFLSQAPGHEHRARCRARASEQMPPARRRVVDAQGPTRALRNQFARVLGDSRRGRKGLCIVPEALGEEAAQRQRWCRGHLRRAERDLELVAEPRTLQSSGGQSQTGVRQGLEPTQSTAGLEPTQSRGTRTSCRWPPFQCSA